MNIQVQRPLFIHTQPLNIATAYGSSSDGINIRISDDFDFLVYHIQGTAFHQGGAINETDDTRDLLLVDISKAGGGEKWFSEPIDLFALFRISNSKAFRPILIKKGEQLNFSAVHNNFVAGAGSPFSTAPIRVYLHLVGQKVIIND